jgi:uncharacterized protein YecA (UPF0149 family)
MASVRQIAWEVYESLQLREPIPLTVEEMRAVGRNDLCPCGSEIKFKKCHGKAA